VAPGRPLPASPLDGAVRLYALQVGDTKLQSEASEIAIRATQRLGEVAEQMRTRGGAGKTGRKAK
jgi:hypothetical protein